MSGANHNNPVRTFTAGGAITQYAAVTLSSGNVVEAGPTDVAIGTALAGAASGEGVAVLLFNAVGTRMMIAASAFSVGADLYLDANGNVSNDASDTFVGIALEQATAANDEVEVLSVGAVAGGPTVRFVEQDIDHADFTDGGGAAGTLDLTDQLPAGALVLGWEFTGTEGFAGDTSATMQVGVSGDADRFSEITSGSVFATATVGSNAPSTGANAYCSAATTVRVTVTTNADFTSVTAGAGAMKLAYIQL